MEHLKSSLSTYKENISEPSSEELLQIESNNKTKNDNVPNDNLTCEENEMLLTAFSYAQGNNRHGCPMFKRLIKKK